MFPIFREIEELKASFAGIANPATTPMVMLFIPGRQTPTSGGWGGMTGPKMTSLDDFLGSVLDESFINKSAADEAARSVCHFPVCCDRAGECTG